MIGCCFDIAWQGTRDQAADLYDYLVNQGYLEPRKQAACGDWDDDNIQYDETFWRCGACGVTYGPGMKEVAVACCKSRVAVAA